MFPVEQRHLLDISKFHLMIHHGKNMLFWPSVLLCKINLSNGLKTNCIHTEFVQIFHASPPTREAAQHPRGSGKTFVWERMAETVLLKQAVSTKV